MSLDTNKYLLIPTVAAVAALAPGCDDDPISETPQNSVRTGQIVAHGEIDSITYFLIKDSLGTDSQDRELFQYSLVNPVAQLEHVVATDTGEPGNFSSSGLQHGTPAFENGHVVFTRTEVDSQRGNQSDVVVYDLQENADGSLQSVKVLDTNTSSIDETLIVMPENGDVTILRFNDLTGKYSVAEFDGSDYTAIPTTNLSNLTDVEDLNGGAVPLLLVTDNNGNKFVYSANTQTGGVEQEAAIPSQTLEINSKSSHDMIYAVMSTQGGAEFVALHTNTARTHTHPLFDPFDRPKVLAQGSEPENISNLRVLIEESTGANDKYLINVDTGATTPVNFSAGDFATNNPNFGEVSGSHMAPGALHSIVSALQDDTDHAKGNYVGFINNNTGDVEDLIADFYSATTPHHVSANIDAAHGDNALIETSVLQTQNSEAKSQVLFYNGTQLEEISAFLGYDETIVEAQSEDGTKAVVRALGNTTDDLYLVDLQSGAANRFAQFLGAFRDRADYDNAHVAFSEDGSTIAYVDQNRAGQAQFDKDRLNFYDVAGGTITPDVHQDWDLTIDGFVNIADNWVAVVADQDNNHSAIGVNGEMYIAKEN